MGLPARIVENKGGSPGKCGTEMGGGLGAWLVQKKSSTIFCNPPSFSTLAWHWHALAYKTKHPHDAILILYMQWSTDSY